MSAQVQFGFNFDTLEQPPAQEYVESVTTTAPLQEQIDSDIEEEISDPPEVEPEQPVLFEGFAPTQREQEPEIPWAEYIRKVELYFDEAQFKAFRENVSKLALKYGTESITDTVAANLERAANGTN